MASSVICFGEILLRLGTSDCELLLQTPKLNAYIGGAEANVAVSLARLGHKSKVVSVLPDSVLGRSAVGELRRHGVETDSIQLVSDSRMGLYFLTTGAGHRPSDVIYDRAESAFAVANPDRIDWGAELPGAQWLHISGITPAVSPSAAQSALRAVRRASQLGISVSFDCNYRAKLWERWKGDAKPVLRELASHAELIFGEERDMALILGVDTSSVAPEERFRAAGAAAFREFPKLRRLATTVRVQHNVDSHEFSGVLMTRNGIHSTRNYVLDRIVDRIGSGDAYAAGVLHGLLTGLDDQATVDFGVAAAVLKQSIPGDFNLADAAEVRSLLGDSGFSVRR